MSPNFSHHIACFITPHGFGHAARAAAVIASLQKIDPDIHVDIFTTVPQWFFESSLSMHFTYHSLQTDIGLVQKNSMCEDLDKTVQSLESFLPFPPSKLSQLSEQLRHLKSELVMCDIAPLGIAVAREAAIPSVLVENFTWDWIYEGYAAQEKRLYKYISYLKNVFETADYRIKAKPARYLHDAALVTHPISRALRMPAPEIREKLNLPSDKKAVLITMGGIREQYGFLDKLMQHPEVCFVIPGAGNALEIHENIFLLPCNSDFFHPDLVNACDAAVGKVGYSTLAEVYHAGIPFGYILRPEFPESEILAGFIETEMAGIPLQESEFRDGTWLASLEKLLALPRSQRNIPNGAEQAARFVWEMRSGK